MAGGTSVARRAFVWKRAQGTRERKRGVVETERRKWRAVEQEQREVGRGVAKRGDEGRMRADI